MHVSLELKRRCTNLEPALWVAYHADDYSFPTKWEKRLQDWIRKCRAVDVYYLEIWRYYEELLQDFQNNPFVYMYGGREKERIEASAVDFYFVEVESYVMPIGFLKLLDRTWRVSQRKCLMDFVDNAGTQIKEIWTRKQRSSEESSPEETLKLAHAAICLEKDYFEIQKKIFQNRREPLERTAGFWELL
ncbi:MAG: hypothetical protein Q4E89_06030 [Eubacteriales bacterium]|nr:hypothetical protein [Eubacteriales bacterium]